MKSLSKVLFNIVSFLHWKLKRGKLNAIPFQTLTGKKKKNEVKSLTSRQIKVYFKQNNLHVSGSKAALVARALDFSHTGTRNKKRDSANDSDTELLSSDSEYDFDSHTSTSENNSDLDSDDSETDGFVEHSYEVLFVPDDDIQQVSVRLKEHDNIKGIYLKASMVMVVVRGVCVWVGGGRGVRRYF